MSTLVTGKPRSGGRGGAVSKLVVRQTRSTIGTPHTMRLVVKGLGLRGIGSVVTVDNTPSFRGMIKKVLHLVEVNETDSAAKGG